MTWWDTALQYGATGGVCLFSIAFAALVAFQEKVIYVPNLPNIPRGYLGTPADYQLSYEDVWLESKRDKTKLHGWLIRPRNEAKLKGPTIVFFQENAGNISHRLEFARYLITVLHCNVFLLSYRGYGDSEGSPSQFGIQQDAETALEYLTERHDLDKDAIFLFGRSLGGAVALSIVNEEIFEGKIKGIILENTFTCIADMANKVMPFVGWLVGPGRPLNFLVRNPWESYRRVSELRVPSLFIVGEQDELVPPSMMVKLYSKASGDKQIVSISDGRHMNTWVVGRAKYWNSLRDFVYPSDGPPNR